MAKRDYLATFRVDTESWRLFQTWCKEQDISASLALCTLVERLGRGALPNLDSLGIAINSTSNINLDIDKKIEEKVKELLAINSNFNINLDIDKKIEEKIKELLDSNSNFNINLDINSKDRLEDPGNTNTDEFNESPVELPRDPKETKEENTSGTLFTVNKVRETMTKSQMARYLNTSPANVTNWVRGEKWDKFPSWEWKEKRELFIKQQ